MSFSGKKTAKFKLGKNLLGKDFVLYNAEWGKKARSFDLKEDFVQPITTRDTEFKLSRDFSVRIENKKDKLRIYSNKIPVTLEQNLYPYKDIYLYTVDIFIKEPGVNVKTYAFAWMDDAETFWIRGKTRREDRTVSEKGTWHKISMIKEYDSKFKAVGMMIEVLGEGTVWIDKPEIRKLLHPFAAPWNDPFLKEDISKNEKISIICGSKVNFSIPFIEKIKKLYPPQTQNYNDNHRITIKLDGPDLCFTFDGAYDETLYVELGGYIGSARENLKKAQEGKVLSNADIENLKALGYIE